MPRAKRNRPLGISTGSPLPVARGTGSKCQQFRVLDDAGNVTGHRQFARDDSHPAGGTYVVCPGSGQSPEGRPVLATPGGIRLSGLDPPQEVSHRA